MTAHTDLGLTDKAATGGGCCGGSCACGDTAAEAVAAPVAIGATEFAVTGMTCNNCVNHVTKAVSDVAGVTGVQIDLNAGGTSTMHLSGTGIDPAAVRAAVETAGYQLA